MEKTNTKRKTGKAKSTREKASEGKVVKRETKDTQQEEKRERNVAGMEKIKTENR